MDLLSAARLFVPPADPTDTPAQVVVLTVKGLRYQVDFPPAPPVELGRVLSPLERRIMATVADGSWKTGRTIAGLVGFKRNNAFNTIMSNLVEAGALESHNRRGYHIPVPVEQEAC